MLSRPQIDEIQIILLSDFFKILFDFSTKDAVDKKLYLKAFVKFLLFFLKLLLPKLQIKRSMKLYFFF